jgi:hypothetical protein
MLYQDLLAADITAIPDLIFDAQQNPLSSLIGFCDKRI